MNQRLHERISIKPLAHSRHSTNSSFFHCSSVFQLAPASAGHLATPSRAQGAFCPLQAITQLIGEEAEALRRLHESAQITRPLGGRVWDHSSLLENSKSAEITILRQWVSSFMPVSDDLHQADPNSVAQRPTDSVLKLVRMTHG